MATYLENLISERDAIQAELLALRSSSGVPVTSTAGAVPNQRGDGVNTDHMGYYRELRGRLSEIVNEIQSAAGPQEYISQGQY